MIVKFVCIYVRRVITMSAPDNVVVHEMPSFVFISYSVPCVQSPIILSKIATIVINYCMCNYRCPSVPYRTKVVVRTIVDRNDHFSKISDGLL